MRIDPTKVRDYFIAQVSAAIHERVNARIDEALAS